MSKILAVILAGLFASAAFAQNPAGASSEQSPVMNSKAQNRAESKVEARPQGMVKKPMADSMNNTEVNPLATGKSAAAADKRLDSKPQGMVKKPMGDEVKSAEINPTAGNKAADAGQAKIAARDAKAAAKKQAKAVPAN